MCFWKSAVDFSDTDKRTELHNPFLFRKYVSHWKAKQKIYHSWNSIWLFRGVSLNWVMKFVLVKKEWNFYSWFITLRSVIYCIIITIFHLCYFIFNYSKTATVSLSFQLFIIFSTFMCYLQGRSNKLNILGVGVRAAFSF